MLPGGGERLSDARNLYKRAAADQADTTAMATVLVMGEYTSYKALLGVLREVDVKPVTEIFLYETALRGRVGQVLGEVMRFNEMRANGSLETIDLVDVKAPTNALVNLAHSIAGCQRLKRLVITCTGFSGLPIDTLQPWLTTTVTLTTLRLIKANLTLEDVRAVALALMKNKTVTILDLSKNGLRHHSAAVLAQMLKYNETLRALDLPWNKITQAGAKALLHGIAWNKSLVKLDVACNRLGDKGAVHMAHLMSNTRVLQELDLTGNEIGQEGGEALCTALHSSNSLRVLRLCLNPLWVTSFHYLDWALLQNHSLVSLDLTAIKADTGLDWAAVLRANRLEILRFEAAYAATKCLVALCDALAVNTSLRELSFGDYTVYEGWGEVTAALARSLCVNGTLESIGLSCFVGVAIPQYLFDALEVNKTVCTIHLNYEYTSTRLDILLERNTVFQAQRYAGKQALLALEMCMRKRRRHFRGPVLPPELTMELVAVYLL
jgi:Ran GTPase-activating protein (RanGAP) involved in mRNA processing and transport